MQEPKRQLNMLSLEVITSKEVDGLELGVLGDGTAFMSGRALATLCGVAFSTLFKFVSEWTRESNKPRDIKVAELLAGHGFYDDALFFQTKINGTVTNAFPDKVCAAILEYYAFEAGTANQEIAKNNFRILVRGSIREFIYRATGYDPQKLVPEHWRHFHDRMLLNTVPGGYFSVFKETADIVVAAIREGLIVDHHTVPDGSVGIMWGKYWRANELEKEYGPREKHPHVYPDYFPQSQAEVEANIYPLAALGEFRAWMQNEYLAKNFPNYLKSKVKQGAIPASSAALLLKAVEPVEFKQLPPGNA